MRELWAALIHEGKIQHVPRKQSRSHTQQLEDPFDGAVLLAIVSEKGRFDDKEGEKIV